MEPNEIMGEEAPGNSGVATDGVLHKYLAFISYAHADRTWWGMRWGRYLHAAIENYRLPRRLATTPSGRTRPARLGPIFLDRAELSASWSLDDEIRERLRASRNLIVICSRRSARSLHVNDEVVHFKSLGRERNVLCLIIDGEPNDSILDDSHRQQECFPPAVRFQVAVDGTLTTVPSQPVAADARRHGDGRRLAILKLIARLADVDFETLRQRQHERDLRSIGIVIVGLIAIVGMLATSTVIAIQQKLVAESSALSLQSDLARGADAQAALRLALQALDKKATPVATLAVKRSIDQAKVRAAVAAVIAWAPSADRAHVVTVDDSASATLRDADTLKPHLQPTHLSYVPQIAGTNLDGDLLAIWSPNQPIELWNLKRKLKLLEIPAPGKLRNLILSPTGHVLFVIGESKLQLWRTSTSELVAEFDETCWGAPHSASFNGDESLLAAALAENRALVLDVRTGRRVAMLDVSEEAVRVKQRMAASLEQYLNAPKATGARDASGRSVNFTPSDADLLSRVVFNGDGRTILTYGSHDIWRLWDATTGRQLSAPQKLVAGNGSAWADFTADGTHILAVDSSSGSGALWSKDGSTKIASYLNGHDNLINMILQSPDARRTVTVGADNIIATWDADTGTLLGSIRVPGARLVAALYTASGNRSLTLSSDGQVVSWDMTGIEPRGRLSGEVPAYVDAHVSSDGRRILTVSADDSIVVWDTASLKSIVSLDGHPGRVNSAALSPDGTRAATVGEDGVRCWDVATGKLLTQYPGRFDFVTFDYSGHWIGATSFQGDVFIVDHRSGRIVARNRIEQNLTNAIEISRDGGAYVLTGNDGTAAAMETTTSRLTRVLRLSKMPFRRAAFSVDGTRLYTTHDDHVVRAWNVTTGQLIASLHGLGTSVSAVLPTTNPDGVLTVSDDGIVRLWSIANQALVSSFRVGSPRLLFAAYVANSAEVLAVDDDGHVVKVRCEGCKDDADVIRLARERVTAGL